MLGINIIMCNCEAAAAAVLPADRRSFRARKRPWCIYFPQPIAPANVLGDQVQIWSKLRMGGRVMTSSPEKQMQLLAKNCMAELELEIQCDTGCRIRLVAPIHPKPYESLYTPTTSNSCCYQLPNRHLGLGQNDCSQNEGMFCRDYEMRIPI